MVYLIGSTTIYLSKSTIVDMETIGERLAKLRNDKKLTFEEVGKIADTTKQNASQIEKGITKAPGGIFLYKWARYYGVNLEWLITGKGDSKDGAPASQLQRPDPAILTRTHHFLARAFEDDGGYSLEDPADADVFSDAYEWLLEKSASSEPAGDNLIDFIEWVKRRRGENGDGHEQKQRGRATGKASAQAGAKTKRKAKA